MIDHQATRMLYLIKAVPLSLLFWFENACMLQDLIRHTSAQYCSELAVWCWCGDMLQAGFLHRQPYKASCLHNVKAAVRLQANIDTMATAPETECASCQGYESTG